MRGAAIAIVVAQFSAAAVGLIFNLKMNKEIRFCFGMLKPHGDMLKRIWNIGFPAALQQSIGPAMTLTTLILGSYFQALGHSTKTLITSLAQFGIMLTAATFFSHVGTVYMVWYAFVIAEILVAVLALLFMRVVWKKTIQPLSDLK